MLKQTASPDGDDASAAREPRCAQLDDDREFLRACNIGGERMRDDDMARVRRIADYRWTRHRRARGQVPHRRRAEEPHHPRRHAHRRGAQDHQPPHRRDHQDARGAALAAPPARTCRSTPAATTSAWTARAIRGASRASRCRCRRACMGIADIFEALTAKDRPYKKGKTLSESLEILGRMQAERPHRPGPVRHLRAATRCTGATRRCSSIRSRSTSSTSRASPATNPSRPFVGRDVSHCGRGAACL